MTVDRTEVVATAPRRAEAPIAADPLAGLDWDRLAIEWGDRRDTSIRSAMRSRGMDGPLRTWGAITYRMHVAPPPVRNGETESDRKHSFTDEVRRSLRQLYEQAATGDPVDRAADGALVTVFAYLQALIAWENNAYYGRLFTYLDVVEEIGVEALRSQLPDQARGEVGDVLTGRAAPEVVAASCPGIAGDFHLVGLAALQMARGLDPQLRTENALFCSCPVDMARRAGRLDDHIERAGRTFDVLRQRMAETSAPTTSIPNLIDLLWEDAEVSRTYFGLLADHVAPAGEQFLGALWDRSLIPEADASLARAVQHLEIAEGVRPANGDATAVAADDLAGLLEGDVFASESKAHRMGLNRMRRALGGPALLVEEGEIAFLHPFAFPEADSSAFVEALLPTRSDGEGADGVAPPAPLLGDLFGFPVDVDPAHTSDAWSNPSLPDLLPDAGSGPTVGNEHWNRLQNRAVSVRFRHHRFFLDTTEPRRIELDLEVRLNSFGYHFIRTTVSTDSRSTLSFPRPDLAPSSDGEVPRHFPPITCTRSDDEVEDPENPTWGPGDGWTGHEINQFVRRVSHDSPEERWQLVSTDLLQPEPVASNGARPTQGPGQRPAPRANLDTRYRSFTEVDAETDPRRTGSLERSRLIDVAGMIVSELRHQILAWARSGDQGPAALWERIGLGPAREGDEPDDDYHAGFNDLHVGAHVMITTTRLAAISGDPRDQASTQRLMGSPSTTIRRIEDPVDIQQLVGASAVFLPQRSEPASLEQWLRVEPEAPPNLLSGIGLPRDVIHRSLDVTFLCPQESPAWAIVPWVELCENSVALVGLYSAWSVWARVRAMDEHTVLTDEDSTPDRNELLHRSKELAAEIGQVRTMLDHIHSLQLTRSVQQSQLFHSLLAAGEVTVAEQNLRSAIDALERQHDSVVAQSDRAWQEVSERREIAFEVILAFLAATGVTGLLGWINSEFPSFDSGHPRWDVYVFLVWVAISIPLIILATGLTRHLPWRKQRPGAHRRRRRPARSREHSRRPSDGRP